MNMYIVRWNTIIGKENEIRREILYAAHKVYDRICEQDTTESASLSINEVGYERIMEFYGGN